MQATMLPFPYSLTCHPSYMDISVADSVTSSSRSGTPSPPAKSYVDRCYESMVASRLRIENPNDANQLSGFSYDSTPRKKSFTIEAILGLNEEPARKNFGVTGHVGDSHREQRTLSPQSYCGSSANSLTTVFNSTTDKKESRSRVHHTTVNTVELDRFSAPSKSTSPNSKAANNCGTVQKNPTHSGKMKRIRTIFTPEQLERLELEFERQQYMVGPERMYLATALGLSESQVKVWFQNRRIKFRKQHLEMQQARLAQLRETETVESENEQEPINIGQEFSPANWDDIVDDRK